MEKVYEADTFTEGDVVGCLQQAGEKFRVLDRYIFTTCPLHEDKNPSAQIFKNDWFVNCMAGCGRFHITKAFPQLRDSQRFKAGVYNVKRIYKEAKKMQEYDLTDWWEKLPLIPRDHNFKNIPVDILDDMGWRWDSGRYFIPYFDSNKETIPFGQWRHLTGDRRFTFLENARPTLYGTWSLPNTDFIFLVEGTSDCAVLQTCAVPYIGAPSASSTSLVGSMVKWCSENGVRVIYAGDKDLAGDKVRDELDKHINYRICQPPGEFKDWGEFYEVEGFETVFSYLADFINTIDI